MAMKIGTFWEQKDVKTYELYEGNVTLTNGFSTLNNQRVEILNFSNEIQDSTFLALSTQAPMTMDKATNNEGNFATHFNPYEPQVPAGFRLNGKLGTSFAWGTYKPRYVGCAEFKVGKEYWLPLSPTNAQLTHGDFLIIQDDSRTLDKLDVKASTPDDQKVLVCLEDIPANAGQEQVYCISYSNKIPVDSS